MIEIWKYRLEPLVTQPISMPYGAEILYVGCQGEDLFLWAQVNPYTGPESRIFSVIGTGMGFQPNEKWLHIGSVITPIGLVWHVFEIDEREES